MELENELITVNTQYLPDVRKSDIKEVFKVSKSLLPQLGLVSKTDGSGLYKCVFPKGVTGTLAIKDGANLGAIMGKDGIVGQARWVEQSINPTMMFAAAALHSVEEKLDELIKVTKDMFEYEQIKDESKLYGNVQYLTKVLRDYQLNAGKEMWLSSKSAQVEACLRESLAYIKQFKELASNAAKDAGLLDNLIHTDDKAAEKVDNVIKYLEQYQKSIFAYTFSEYVQVLVTENYDEDHLLNVQKDIEQLSIEYRNVFDKISLKLENYAKKSLDLKAIELAGDVTKALGDVAKKTPLIKKTNAGNKLLFGGDSLKEHSKDSINKKIKNLGSYNNPPVQSFNESLRELSDMHHKELEVYTDNDYVYFADPQDIQIAVA